MTSKFEGDRRMTVSISPPDGTRQLQGQLVAGDVIAEAGLSAQPKRTRKPIAQTTRNDDGAVLTEVAALDR
jgi:hypothetical protein